MLTYACQQVTELQKHSPNAWKGIRVPWIEMHCVFNVEKLRSKLASSIQLDSEISVADQRQAGPSGPLLDLTSGTYLCHLTLRPTNGMEPSYPQGLCVQWQKEHLSACLGS